MDEVNQRSKDLLDRFRVVRAQIDGAHAVLDEMGVPRRDEESEQPLLLSDRLAMVRPHLQVLDTVSKAMGVPAREAPAAVEEMLAQCQEVKRLQEGVQVAVHSVLAQVFALHHIACGGNPKSIGLSTSEDEARWLLDELRKRRGSG